MPNVRKQPWNKLTWRRTVPLLPDEGRQVQRFADKATEGSISAAMRKLIRDGLKLNDISK